MAALIGLLVTAVAALGIFVTAGASTPTEGASVPDSAVPVGTFTANTPFASGQNINVVIPANSVFSANTNLAIIECSAPNGVIPVLPAACDGDTIQGPTLKPNADGSVNFQTEVGSLYQIFALPDYFTLGETPGGPACGDTAATECILYIGENQNDFTQPHLWSQPFFIATSATDSGTPAGDGSAPSTTTTTTATTQPTTLTTSLSGGGQSGATISVPTSTAVTDTATLSGTNAATATGTVTYNVYSDSACTTLAPGGGGTAETITTAGTLPPSAPVTLASAGTYYWGVTYSGDSTNQTSSSTCGTAGEVETVTAATTTQPTTLTTSLSGGGWGGHRFRWGRRIVIVTTGTSVTDSATLRGANASVATGTVTYAVYSQQAVMKNNHRSWSWVVVAGVDPGTVTVAAGQVPKSNAVSLPAGVYEWQASYSGDSANGPSTSRFGSETEIVLPAPTCGHGSWRWACNRHGWW